MTDQNAQAGTEQAPVPGSPEYDAAMAARFRESQSTITADSGLENLVPETPAAPTRPDDVPEKFWDAATGQVNVAALLKSYTELEKGRSQAPGADKTTPVQIDAQAAQQSGDAQAAVEQAGLDWDALGNKIAATGTIEATDYEALAKIGVPKNVVDGYITSVQNSIAAQRSAAEAYVGGSQDPAENAAKTQELLDWAAQTLTPEEITGYNQMLNGPQWKVALDTLKTRQAQTNPASKEPKLLGVKSAGQGTTVGYQTEAEMHADMRNPLYHENSPKGEQFRAEVANKVRLASYRRQSAA